MKNKTKIAIDFDGCLGRTMDEVCRLINFKTGENHTYKDIDRWTYWQDIGYDKEFWQIYDDFDKVGRLLIKPYDNWIQDSLQKVDIITDGFEIVTANNPGSENTIYDWIEFLYRNPEEIPFFKINCVGRKGPSKLTLDYNIYIDDSPAMALEAENYPDKQVLLANAPWNKNIPNTNNVTRFESWKEVPGLIKNIINKNK